MEEFEIRDATKEDAALFAEYRFRMFVDMHPETDFESRKKEFVRKSEVYYSGHLGSKDEYSCVVVVSERVVACGSISFWDRPPHIDYFENNIGYVHSIYVRKEFRRRGISKAVMARLHEEARKRGMRKVGLHASESGRLVYKPMGYKGNDSYLEVERKRINLRLVVLVNLESF